MLSPPALCHITGENYLAGQGIWCDYSMTQLFSDLIDLPSALLTIGRLRDFVGSRVNCIISRAFLEYAAIENLVFQFRSRSSLLSRASFTTLSALTRDEANSVACYCRYSNFTVGISVNRGIWMIFGEADRERPSHLLRYRLQIESISS